MHYLLCTCCANMTWLLRVPMPLLLLSSDFTLMCRFVLEMLQHSKHLVFIGILFKLNWHTKSRIPFCFGCKFYSKSKEGNVIIWVRYVLCSTITIILLNLDTKAVVPFLMNESEQYCCDRKSRVAWAQSFALWQQAMIEFTCHDHSIIACSRHIYVWCCSSHTSRSWWIHNQRNTTGDVATVPY